MERIIRLGRDAANQINLDSPATRRSLKLPEKLPADALDSVGRHHVNITFRETEEPPFEQFVLEEPRDGSTNGTFVNNRRIARYVLRTGQTVGIGALPIASDALMLEVRRQVFKNQLDFSRQFARLEPVFREKEGAASKIDFKNNLRAFGAPVLAAVTCFALGQPGLGLILSGASGFVLKAFVFKESAVRAEKDKLEARFQKTLRCPNPHCDHALNRSLAFYKQRGGCEFCKAVFYSKTDKSQSV